MNIEAAFKEFLIDKQQILNTEQQEDYKDYEEVIDLFTQFLNGYAYLGLDTEDAELFDNLYNTAGKEFCDIFGPEYIGTYDVEEFRFRCKKSGHFTKSLKTFTIREVNQLYQPKNST